jgi:transcription initiation factor IIE alpha subunit
MKKIYFDWEYVFEHICKRADADGLWDGNDDSIAVSFGVTENEAREMLSALSDQGLIEELYPGKYAIVKWRERDDPGEEDHN